MAKILIIDDESNVRLMLRLALQKDGHQVSAASDGAQGLEIFDLISDFDVILLDYRMSGMDGMEVLRALKKRDGNVKVVMITAFGTLDLASQAMREGVAGFLRKPFTTEILRGTIKTVLNEDNRSSFTINGFSIRATKMESVAAKQVFEVTSPEAQSQLCTVELRGDVMAELDRYNVPPATCARESLANYLWQNAEMPDDEILFVDELSSQLKRHLADV